VLVMDPNLIPNSVNLVIGDNLYELKFWGGVEWRGRGSSADGDGSGP
jgi:hypothetical protein